MKLNQSFDHVPTVSNKQNPILFKNADSTVRSYKIMNTRLANQINVTQPTLTHSNYQVKCKKNVNILLNDLTFRY